MTIVTNLHFADKNNVGDMSSPPSLYLEGLGKPVDISEATEADYTIYGGGSMTETATSHARGRSGIKIAWGIGYTERGRFGRSKDQDYSVFDLAGIRDYGRYGGIMRWVPCASCLSPLFDKEYLVSRKVVYYGHKLLSPMDGPESLNNDCMDMEKVIAHLASGETVVTSSYHGAYWATLLGRRVVCIPYGSKFFSLRHQPTFVDRYEGQQGRFYLNALKECRSANMDFYNEFRVCIQQHD